MLHSKNISELLTQNVHPQLYPNFLIASTSGSLLAYSTPSDLHLLRNTAAIVSKMWSEAASKSKNSQGSGSRSLRAITAEWGRYNLVARSVNEELILVLVCKVPVRQRDSSEVIIETEDEPIPGAVEMQAYIEEGELKPLKAQRRKTEVLAQFIKERLEGDEGAT